MIRYSIDGAYLICDKCYSQKNINPITMLTKDAREKYKLKRIFCGKCIQKRIHKKDLNWRYSDEFSYNFEFDTKFLDNMARFIV